MARVTFVAGESGSWAIESISALKGDGLGSAKRLHRAEASDFIDFPGTTWSLRGIRSHDRYVEREEKLKLTAIQPPLDRAESLCAILIPIKKNAEWWSLAQDERRRLFEEQSHHIAIGLEYL